MSDIFREIDEEVRKERYLSLWKKYGPWVIGLAVAIVALVAGWQGWQAYQASQAEDAAQRYAAIDSRIWDGETDQALQELNTFADADGSGYALLAAFRQAELQAEQGNVADAVRTWERVAANSRAPAPLRDLAAIHAVLHQMDSADPDALDSRLAELAGADGAFRTMALELRAVLAQRQGDAARASEIYSEIAEDPRAPASQRQRASRLRAVLEG